ncbi:DUF6543 domain-containing protein [Pseudomonas sp. COW5]|uniref:dermonecrotic toxin domain-containing protein n=1 Tax=Pseudomonas sp. COW5 TaxID=2981253 RepID=UPI0022455396|nr:DUF6543 domain-containing protein [Pseudomonas sp. COW5]MCX2543489.1 hypothetical protein [Pseudomonas sp. COW5]
MPEIPHQKELDLLTELVTGPSVNEVAAHFLRPELDALYPQLKIDPMLAMVVTPTWLITEDRVVPGNNLYESLTRVLVKLAYAESVVNYIDGEHFLTLHPGDESRPHLAVKIDAIGRLLNSLAPLLFNAWQQQQLDYWNQETTPSTPRWHQLSRSLQAIWNLDPALDWSEDEKAIARAVFDQPERVTRRAKDKYLSRACLIDCDSVIDGTSRHAWILDVAVLVGTLGDRTFVITHSIVEGFRRYDSIEALSGRLPARHDLQWRLYEPDGNFFHHQACALIGLETEAIGELNMTDDAAAVLPPGRASPGNPTRRERPSPLFDNLQNQIPDWLENASSADLTRYSRHLMDLANLREQDAGKSFLDDIPTLQAFTLQKLREQMIKDQPGASALKLENVEIRVTSLIVLGTFIVPGQTQTLNLSLVELALQNLIALPLGNKTVQYKNGDATPEWMTPAYLETLVARIDVGATYPALIRQKLLSDPQETLRRQNLFGRHLQIQLPLQALQFKIRDQAGIDERGYQYVLAVMQESPADRCVDGQEIIIRPLAFTHGNTPVNTADSVANMFVIGPRLATKGPCLLYRPLLDPPLLQYPGEANLLYAIKRHKLLRQSVLAWLPDDVRFNYSQYVFPGELPSVWTIGQWLVEPGSLLGKMASVTFSTKMLEGEIFASLFKANADAMITLADRQSVSNAEARWETLKQGAWKLFNGALPFLGRTVGTAAWIWQIMDDLQQAVDAKENDDSQVAWAALTDLLLTLGMVLAHQAARPRSPTPQTEKTEVTRPLPQASPSPKATVTRLPDWQSSQPPASHESSLHSLGALTPKSLGALLDALSTEKPAGLNAPSHDSGPHRHLHELNRKWYAQVGERWFEVMLNDNEDVQIVDSRKMPLAKGPLLTHSAKGEWFIDTRLRLRGGGRRAALQRANEQRREALKQQLKTFDARKLVMQTELEAAEKSATDTDQKTLIDLLDSQVNAYGTYIEQLKTYNALEAISNYRPVIVSCLDRQLSLTQKWFVRSNREYGERMRQSLALLDKEHLEDELTPRQIHQRTSDLTQGFIDRIEFARARIDELTRLGKEASEVAREYSTQLPRYKLQDLKMFQVSMAQELCLSDDHAIDTTSARRVMQWVVEDAALTIQSFLDLAEESESRALPERIDALSDLVEQFANLDQRIADLADEYPVELLKPPLELMRARVEAFNEPAVKQLAGLLHERRAFEPTPGPYRVIPTPKRIIKTRFKGTVVGTRRPSTGGKQNDLYDVTSPLTGKVIATFHEKTPGNWVEHLTRPVQAPGPERPGLDISVQKGRSLIDQLEPFLRRTETHALQDGRIPVEIEEMFNQQATRMREAAEAIENALTDLNATEGGPDSAVTLTRQLSEGAAQLIKKGRLTRISMIKRQPPTAARIEWLQGEGLVKIVKIPGRKPLKGNRKDFLEEYEIRERVEKADKKAESSGAVLWYAHFHYPRPDAPASGYTAAHLKTASQRRLGGGFDLRSATSNSELIAIYRSEISPRLAMALFLSGPGPSASAN